MDSRKQVKPKPKAANVKVESSPIPGLSRDQYTKLMKQLNEPQKSEVNMAGKTVFANPWVIDSGATDHVVCNKSYLSSIKCSEDNVPISIPNGDKVPVKGIGKTFLLNDVEITNVLYIPNFKCNLLSVSKMTRHLNCFITFFFRILVLFRTYTRGS